MVSFNYCMLPRIIFCEVIGYINVINKQTNKYVFANSSHSGDYFLHLSAKQNADFLFFLMCQCNESPRDVSTDKCRIFPTSDKSPRQEIAERLGVDLS